MENLNEKFPMKFQELSEEEKLKLFETEELEGRLETAWNDSCPVIINEGCQEQS